MPDDRVDPREEAAVRRLLAQARHDDPIPSEVAARLDDALAGLRDEPVEAAPSSPAVASLSRARRRRAGALLLAAAAVVVIGFGIGQVVQPGQSESSSSADSTAGSTSRNVERGSSSRSGRAPTPEPSKVAPQQLQDDALSRLAMADSPARISEQRFGRDVRAVRSRLDAESRNGASQPDALADEASFPCAKVPLGTGAAVAVRYDQAPAVLVLRPPTGESQVVDLLSCADGAITRSVTLPAR